MYETWYKMTQMIKSGLNVATVLTHRFPAAEYEQAFATMKSGNCGKVLLEWTDK
jgi:threonine 3-dehydrogenase